MYKNKDEFEDEEITSGGMFIYNPPLLDITGKDTGIWGYSETHHHNTQTIIRDYVFRPDDYLLPDNWKDGEYWLDEYEATPDVRVVDALDQYEIEEIEGWGIKPEDLETLKDPNALCTVIKMTISDRRYSDYDYDYYEYKFVLPEDWV